MKLKKNYFERKPSRLQVLLEKKSSSLTDRANWNADNKLCPITTWGGGIRFLEYQ